MTSAPMKISALAPWFGGCRQHAEAIAEHLGDLAWCGVLFAGGMPELPYIRTKAGLAIDKHRHIINLARVVAEPRLLVKMIKAIDRHIFHPDVLLAAQRRCLDREHQVDRGLFGSSNSPADLEPDPQWAADYFTCCWMGRGGYAGRGGELTQSIAVRYSASGGSSAKRWRSAVESLPAWAEVFAKWEFSVGDAFAVLARLRPQPNAGLYLDPPWVGAGDEYCHRMSTEQHRKLAELLDRLDGYRIVIRYGDDPLIRGLYPADRWRWIEATTRGQQNNEVNEVLIVKGNA